MTADVASARFILTANYTADSPICQLGRPGQPLEFTGRVEVHAQRNSDRAANGELRIRG